MPIPLYSYRLGRVVPLLDEAEWQAFVPLLNERLSSISAYRLATGATLQEALQNDPVGQRALMAYRDMTGTALDHPDQLAAVRRSDYGDPCSSCGKPFRTPRATFCAECGHKLPQP